MNAQYVTNDIKSTNRLLKLGWKIVDHKLAVSAGGMNGKGLSSYGVDYVASMMRVEARTFILELENAKECKGSYHSDECCDYTFFKKEAP